MNALTGTLRWLAPALCIALACAAAAELAAAEQRPVAAAASAPATVAAAGAAPQRPAPASASAVDNSEPAARLAAPALDWTVTPRRSTQGRRR